MKQRKRIKTSILIKLHSLVKVCLQSKCTTMSLQFKLHAQCIYYVRMHVCLHNSHYYVIIESPARYIISYLEVIKSE